MSSHSESRSHQRKLAECLQTRGTELHFEPFTGTSNNCGKVNYLISNSAISTTIPPQKELKTVQTFDPSGSMPILATFANSNPNEAPKLLTTNMVSPMTSGQFTVPVFIQSSGPLQTIVVPGMANTQNQINSGNKKIISPCSFVCNPNQVQVAATVTNPTSVINKNVSFYSILP